MLLSLAQQLECYRRMVRIRQFDESLDANEIAGHLSIGQEAANTGACMALRDEDYITGTHRSHGHPIGKGAALRPLMPSRRPSAAISNLAMAASLGCLELMNIWN